MGGGSSTTTQDTSSSTFNQIPEWVSQAGQQNYALAQNIAEQPLQQYQGQMVAGISPQTQQAWNLAAQAGGLGQDQYNAATAGYLGSLGQTPMQVTNPGNANAVTAGMLSNTNLQPYMDPYTQSVINTTLPIMQQNLALQQNQQQNAANAQNAFGGSRQAVQQGVTQAQGAQNMAQMAAQLQQQNFGQAQTAATADINRQYQAAVQNQASQQTDLARQMQAQQYNQAAQQAKINSDIAASQGLTSTGNAINQAAAQQYGMLASAGAAQQAQAQSEINAQMDKFNQAWTWPQQGLTLMESTLSQTPYPTATQSAGQSTQTQTQSPNWGNLIPSLLQAGSSAWGMFSPTSDPKAKKDVASLGEDPVTQVPIKSFRYKGQPATAPKTVGPMAPDVEKVIPGSTAKVDGVQHVARGALAAAAPSLGSSPAFSANQPPVTGALAQKVQKYKFGTPNVGPNNGPFVGGGGALAGPARADTVPAMLTPGEAVLTGPAAQAVGRRKIAALNAMMPPAPVKATSMPRAGARGLQGALANTRLRPKIAGALSGG